MCSRAHGSPRASWKDSRSGRRPTLRWSLVNHFLPHFAAYLLTEITPHEVDRWKVAKAKERQDLDGQRADLAKAQADGKRLGEKVERGLSNSSINHSDLAQVLETAVEYGLIASNPASGKRRRLKAAKPNRPWVEPEQLPALLDAARGDTVANVGHTLVALLASAGLRIDEALSLRRAARRGRHGDTPCSRVEDRRGRTVSRPAGRAPARHADVAGDEPADRAARLRPPHIGRTEAQPVAPAA